MNQREQLPIYEATQLGSLAPRLLGQCSLGSSGFSPWQRSYTGSGPLSATCSPSLQNLPISSLLISHVTHSPSRPVLGVFDWWLSLQPLIHAGSSLAEFSTLKVEGIHSSETSVQTRSTRRHIHEDVILHSHRCENLKSTGSIFNWKWCQRKRLKPDLS
jgi:hypothetical protein